ncbi:hypothetical protein WMY93_021962 [Mugilogobius chulae]|uniref:PiggyBac transposable element-derived protein domain-containing protein n=1 Tax=Mugilogobius chulae TaxID=88201 RepID=A0AAW0NH37_9GOBI
MKRTRETLSVAQALALFHELNEGESDGGELSDFNLDSSDEDDYLDKDWEPAAQRSETTAGTAVFPSVQDLGCGEPSNGKDVTTRASTPVRNSARPTVRAEELESVEVEDAPAPVTLQGKDGTVWTTLHPGGRQTGRQQSQNVLKEAAGPVAEVRHSIKDAESAFLALLDLNLLCRIRDCSVAEAHRVDPDAAWELSLAELKAFIALLYVRGAYNKSLEMESLWSEEWGLPFFRSTMARNKYREIMRYLRFDLKEDRQARLSLDRFALVSDVWKGFVANCVRCYKPGPNITVDEQLFPSKTRCPFTQYMANKPDKFGIKFWIAADVDTKYFLHGSPYLGKDPSRPVGQRLGESVVMSLMEPYLDKGQGRNVTVDNFFTSLSLAKRLLGRNTSLVGTMNASRRELPPSVQNNEELYSTRVFAHDRATLTVYQAKRKKTVSVLSTMHQAVSTRSDLKKKPETITYYNVSKVGVDCLDQMTRKYTVKGATRRWPVAVFYNILDLAAINAWILFRQCTGSSISRRDFILELAKQLREDYLSSKSKPAQLPPLSPPHPEVQAKRRQCQCKLQGPTGACTSHMPSYACVTTQCTSMCQTGTRTASDPTSDKLQQKVGKFNRIHPTTCSSALPQSTYKNAHESNDMQRYERGELLYDVYIHAYR